MSDQDLPNFDLRFFGVWDEMENNELMNRWSIGGCGNLSMLGEIESRFLNLNHFQPPDLERKQCLHHPLSLKARKKRQNQPPLDQDLDLDLPLQRLDL